MCETGDAMDLSACYSAFEERIGKAMSRGDRVRRASACFVLEVCDVIRFQYPWSESALGKCLVTSARVRTEEEIAVADGESV